MNYLNQIDEYILGKLPAKEEDDFRQQLLLDSNLADEVKKRELILSGLEALGNEKMRDHIKAVRKEMLAEASNNSLEKGKNRSLFIWLSAAAAIFVLCWTGWYLLNPTTINAEAIFAETYSPYLEDFGSRGPNSTKDYLQAVSAYEAKDYIVAIPLLESILKMESQNSEVELILGDCLLSINKTEEAIEHFNAVIARKTNLYNDPAQWFLALSYLKQNKIEACQKTLQSLIQDPQADYYKEAKALLSKIQWE